jgi:hypothetical protein
MPIALLLVALLFASPATRPGDRSRFTDFDDAAANGRWRMVNDNVMGGRSLGDVSFDGGVMTFAGSINTNGGGFSSTRLRLQPGELAGVDTILLRVKTDGRPYRLLVEDDRQTRRRISHRGDFAAPASDDWQLVEIDLNNLTPTWRGNRMRADPLHVDRAITLGITLVDDADGPFELQVDWLDLIRP